jgi:hypothetical protein
MKAMQISSLRADDGRLYPAWAVGHVCVFNVGDRAKEDREWLVFDLLTQRLAETIERDEAFAIAERWMRGDAP